MSFALDGRGVKCYNYCMKNAVMSSVAVRWGAVVAFSMLGLTGARAADIFPNPHRITRYVGTNQNETLTGVVNAGTLYKRGTGTTTMSAPALTTRSTIRVQEGGVVLAMDDAPVVPELPAYLGEKFALWLDPAVNMVTDESGLFVEKWYDRRETAANIAAGTPVYPYLESGNKRNGFDDSVYEIERRPNYHAAVSSLGNLPAIDFGEYGSNGARWMHVMNYATNNATWAFINVRTMFAVCASSEGSVGGRFPMFAFASTAAGIPYWTGAKDYLWGDTVNVRIDKGATWLDRNPVRSSRLPVFGADWHLLEGFLPHDTAAINQIGLDRVYPQYSGGGLMAEWIVLESRLSEFDRLRVEDYLWKKWFGSRQTAFGTLQVNTNATVEIKSSSDIFGTASGAGRIVVNGAGRAYVQDGSFSGAVELKQGTVLQDGVPFAVTEAGQKLNAIRIGEVTRESADAGVVEKYGQGVLKVSSISDDAKTLRVSEGTLVLAPRAESEGLPAAADFPNADFEGFAPRVGAGLIWNGAGNANSCTTNSNWAFDRSAYSSGYNLAIVISTNAYHDTVSHWNFLFEDSMGIGCDGRYMAYLCKGKITGFFTLAAPGLYRVSFRTAKRGANNAGKVVKILVDDVEVCETTSFSTLEFLQFDAALPFLEAGAHTLTIAESAEDALTYMFDDVKILPVAACTAAPSKVAIQNPGFEEPASIMTSNADVYVPNNSERTGWTASTAIDNDRLRAQLARRWVDNAQNFSTGTLGGVASDPEEMAEGFMCAKIIGNGSLSQDVTFPSPGRYRLSFSLAKRHGQVDQEVVVSVGGTVVRKVWVREDGFREYAADFDVTEAGTKSLVFAGTQVQGSSFYLYGCAFLDEVSLVRTGDIQENLLANGDFESGCDNWTYRFNATNTANIAAANWPCSIPRAPLNGANSMAIRSNGAARQWVSLEPGRYKLSFKMEADRGSAAFPEFFVGIAPGETYANYDYITWMAVLTNTAPRLVETGFNVATSGVYMLEFHAQCPRNTVCNNILVDDVMLTRDTSDVSSLDYSASIPRGLAIEVAADAMLNLDFDGTASVDRVVYNGRSFVGEISHALFPSWVMGRGTLSVLPKGTCILVR